MKRKPKKLKSFKGRTQWTERVNGKNAARKLNPNSTAARLVGSFGIVNYSQPPPRRKKQRAE